MRPYRAVLRRLADEAGHTLMELLVVFVLLIVVVSATLTMLTQVEQTTKANTRQNEAQEKARLAADSLARDLRNLSSPTDELPNALERAQAQDIIFQTVDRTKPGGSLNATNTRRARYCLDPVTGRLWSQAQTWTTAAAPALPSTTSCPQASIAGGWSEGRVLAEQVVNGSGRAAFAYNSVTLNQIAAVRVELFVDVAPNARPGETHLSTGVFLRNQNRAPTASATVSKILGQPTKVLLNGSGASDPEGKGLTFSWYQGAAATGTPVRTFVEGECCDVPLLDGTHQFTLKVEDPAGLSSTQTVSITLP